jgi:DNA-directed RNA polymerase specialized sigma24 family protein
VKSQVQTRASGKEYALPLEFCELFKRETSRFYYLALLVTGDANKAEQCFEESLAQCLTSSRVFKTFVERWAIHTIFKAGIRIATSDVKEDAPGTPVTNSQNDVLAATLRELPFLDRVAYLMTVLEKYSDAESAAFLGCTAKEVKAARQRAAQQLAVAPSPLAEDQVPAGVRSNRACA